MRLKISNTLNSAHVYTFKLNINISVQILGFRAVDCGYNIGIIYCVQPYPIF